MIKCDYLDFLEFFDTKEYITHNEAVIQYTLASEDNIVLTVIIYIQEEEVLFKLSSQESNIFTFKVKNIRSIICDKMQINRVRFLFYELNTCVPIAVLYVKPYLTLDFDIEHKYDVDQFPYREIKDQGRKDDTE